MEFSHVPVLLNEVLEGLNVRENGIYVDGTLGGAGHGREIAARLGAGGIFVGIDRDRDALDASRSRLADLPCRVELVQSNYSQIKLVMSELGLPGLDGALLDLGVSSFQLDNPERGFSYMHDAPLDMRMNADDSLTAEDVVNGYSAEELARIIRDYGEERWAARIADFIVRARAEKRLTSTFELVDVIKAAVPASARRDGPHPAKRTFQALRIEVNDELGQLRTAVDDFIDCLAPGGRLAIISFHSLEDRIVKESFQKRLNPCICPPDLPVCVCGRKPDIKKVTRKPVTASAAELEANPRARSAKLRVIEKLERES
jgi:16S rRNA (cytosine1402-N4)-methyltransferase